MQRAWSVGEEKGAVSCWASQERSVDGREERGNRAAWLSAALKSRHLRQTPGIGPLSGFGLDAWSAARFGREERGIGGGL